jgi:thymidylate synthase
MNVADIRSEFVRKYRAEEFVTDKTGVKMVEIVGQSFVADADTIFGEVNHEYIARELEWYKSQSLNVNLIPPPVPAIWKQVATPAGFINSNYGYLMYSAENGSQFSNVVSALLQHRETRRATAIYTRPSMHTDFNAGGMSDFICTNAVSYLIRDNKLNAVVQMRSNDAIFGYKNDIAWQRTVLAEVAACYNGLATRTEKGVEPITLGNIHWNASSLHCYERHFKFIQEFIDSGLKVANSKVYN